MYVYIYIHIYLYINRYINIYVYIYTNILGNAYEHIGHCMVASFIQRARTHSIPIPPPEYSFEPSIFSLIHSALTNPHWQSKTECFNWAAHNVNCAQDLAKINGWDELKDESRKVIVDALPSIGKPAAGAKRHLAPSPGEGAGPKKAKIDSSHSQLVQLEEQLPLSMGISYIEYAKVKKPSP